MTNGLSFSSRRWATWKSSSSDGGCLTICGGDWTAQEIVVIVDLFPVLVFFLGSPRPAGVWNESNWRRPEGLIIHRHRTFLIARRKRLWRIEPPSRGTVVIVAHLRPRCWKWWPAPSAAYRKPNGTPLPSCSAAGYSILDTSQDTVLDQFSPANGKNVMAS